MRRHALIAVGIDPGPTPGFVGLTYDDTFKLVNVDVLQVSAGAAPAVLRMLLRDRYAADLLVVGIEAFVAGHRAARSSTPRAGRTTRGMVGELGNLWDQHHPDNGVWRERAAALVKPWASDLRLGAARVGGVSLYELTTGMRHARDGAKHALFAACKDGGVPDPLSNGGRR